MRLKELNNQPELTQKIVKKKLFKGYNVPLVLGSFCLNVGQLISVWIFFFTPLSN